MIDHMHSTVSAVCCASSAYESLMSDSFRILYRCGPCKLASVCIACAHHCHVQHCLELSWSTAFALSRECDCFESGKCVFDSDSDVRGD